jgi:plastocyanin
MGQMRKVAAAGVALVAGIIGYGVAGAAPSPQDAPESANVLVKGLSYAPPTVDVKVGGKVVWTFDDRDELHTVTADDNSFGSPAAGQKTGTYEHVFDTARSVNYHCDQHPTMVGTVNVR